MSRLSEFDQRVSEVINHCMSLVLEDYTFRQLRDLICKESGIYIPDSKKYFLESRLMRRIREKNLRTFEEYLYLLQSNVDHNELSKLYDAITTNETSFFREPQQFEVLIKHILPVVMEQRKGRGGIKIWSAGCSTGEEPYTILMLLMENNIMRNSSIEIIASDISEGALEFARRGIYSSYSVRNVPESYLKKYFMNIGQSYELNNAIKEGVRFTNVNLVDGKKMKLMYHMDVIFCRNVLIYFDDEAKQKTLSLLYNCLKPGGFLFLGLSESLHSVTQAFKPIIINKVVVYQKE